MRIEIFGTPGSGPMTQTRALVDEAVSGADEAIDVTEVAVTSPEQARALKSFGTPTVRVDGIDIEYGDREPEEYSAGGRFYATPEGWKPVPAAGMVGRAIEAARERARRVSP